MTFRIFVLILAASQTLALEASALTRKPHHVAADREMSARADTYYRHADRQPAAEFTPPVANPADPPSNANGQ